MEIISCKEELMKEKNIFYTVGRKQNKIFTKVEQINTN